jgi:hypothetical protein
VRLQNKNKNLKNKNTNKMAGGMSAGMNKALGLISSATK